jgi:hypothetical protein
MFPLDSILNIGGKIIDRLFPDPLQAEAAKIKLLEMQQNGELAKMANDTEVTKAYLADLGSARSRESIVAASENAPYLNKVIVPVLALGVLLATFGLFAFVLFDSNTVDPTRKDILIYVLGVLSAIATQIVSYYFGSSKGSNDKNIAIDKMMNK